jgi:hypothetical protein
MRMMQAHRKSCYPDGRLRFVEREESIQAWWPVIEMPEATVKFSSVRYASGLS